MIDPERIQRLAAKLVDQKDALEMVHQMRCGGKKYPGGGKFFRTNLQNESPLMYQPMVDINYPIETPLRFRPQPDLGDYQAPASTGMIVNYPISLPERVPVSVQEPVSAPIVVKVPEQSLFSDEMIARRALKQRYAESAFDDKAKSHAGAQGAWQIMPITLKDYLGRGRGKAGDLNDPEYNRKVRDWVMGIIPRDLQEFWSEDDSDRAKLAKLYAAYNWGAGNLRGFLRKKRDSGVDISNPDNWVNDLNPETRRYVKYLAFDEDIPDSTVYTNAAFEKAAAERGYAEGGRLFEMGGDSGQKPKNTEEYINQQRDAARVLAHENSLKQAHQVVPVMGYVDGSPVYGDSCLYTALDNYGNPKYMVPGNTQFFNMPEKYGFMKISVKDALPGDVVQRGGYNDFDSGYVPTHGMIFDGYDANGNPLFNYSRGSREPDAPSDIRIHSPYQHEPMDDFFYRAYRFVGLPEDELRWAGEYREKYPLRAVSPDSSLLLPPESFLVQM